MFLGGVLRATVLAGLISLSPASSASDLDGVWQTEGYGYVLQFEGERLDLYEVTSISCLKSALSVGARQPGEIADVEAKYPVSIPGFIDADLEVRAGEIASQKILHRTDTNTYMTAFQLERLPARCALVPGATSDDAYKVFWQTFAEQYPFFSLAGVDWNESRSYRGAESEQSLYTALVDAVMPLADSHVALVAPSLEQMYFGSEGETGASDAVKAEAATVIEANYVAGPFTYFANNQIAFAPLKSGASYMRVDGFYGYSDTGTASGDMDALAAALSEIIPQLDPSKGLVLDVRSNSGGSDKLSLELASRFTDRDYTAYRKQAVVHEGLVMDWTEGNPTVVTPSPRETYMGPIVLLTGPDTVSAAETFTMALMERSPEVTRVGGATRGAFSDMLPRALPNGWLFALPNERYVDRSGTAYDRVGIPPHVKTDVFSEKDLGSQKDSAIEAAIDFLSGGS